MLKVYAITDSHTHFSGAIEEYLKRTRGFLELKTIKPEKSDNPELIRRRESERLKELLEKEKGWIVYADIGEKIISTEAFAEKIERLKNSYPNIIFVIGGAYGIDESIVGDRMNERISFSPMTFPHSLALLILLEQLYRTGQIVKNTGYHH